MARITLKIGGKYLEYSTVLDKPITRGMTLEEYEKFYRDEYGNYGWSNDFAHNFGLADQFGSSVREDAETVIQFNIAGPNDRELTVDEMDRLYCQLESIDGWSVPIAGDGVRVDLNL